MNLSTDVQAPLALIKAIDEYQTRFREKRFMPISKIYDLFPKERHETDNWRKRVLVAPGMKLSV